MGKALIFLLTSVLLLKNGDGQCPKIECRPKFNCLCPDIPSPPASSGDLRVVSTPQFVVFTFQGNVNQHSYDSLTDIFTNDRINPMNVGRATPTVFVSDKSITGIKTDYCAVGKLFREDGFEIASHSLSYREPSSWWTKQANYNDWFGEIEGQRRKLHDEADIPISNITGWRSPFFGSNKFQYDTLTNRKFEYDSTIIYSPKKTDNGKHF